MKFNLNKFSDLQKRMIFGFSGFFLILGGMIWNEWTYFFVFFVICFACLAEFYRLFLNQGLRPNYYLGIGLGMLAYVLTFFLNLNWLDGKYLYLFYPLFSLVFIVELYKKQEKQQFINVALTLLGMVYIALPFASLHVMAVDQHGLYRYQILLGYFFMIWIHDIGAYFIGFRYGKHPLFKRISPNKSWEGSLGGLIMSLLMAGLLSIYLTELTLLQWLVVALIVVVLGTQGDLVESMFKRSIQVKDSSGALPGHGGFLDRFDNLLFSAPFTALFLKLFL